MSTIVLASNNRGKISEFNALFQGIGDFNIKAQSDFFSDEAVENALSFVENALLKARFASKRTGLPAIADDSGLVVPSLNGEPGIFSARYAGVHGDDKANNQHLLARLAKQSDRQAMFVCTIVYLRHANDPLPIIASGKWHGEIAQEMRGENGFGYDPLFFIPSLGKTAAELSKEEKNRLSHRAQAMRIFLQQLKEL